MIGNEKIVLMYNNAMRTFGSEFRYKWNIGAVLIEAWKAEVKASPFIGFELDPGSLTLMGFPVNVDYEKRYMPGME